MPKEPGERPPENPSERGKSEEKIEIERAKFLEKTREENIEMHSDMFKRYAIDYFGKVTSPGGHSEANQAYGMLHHGSKVDRYTGNSEVFNLCKSLKPEILRKLVLDACAFMETVTLEEKAKELTQIDAFSDEDMEEAEDLLMFRDWVEAAFQLARKLVQDEWKNDKELRGALAMARIKTRAGDQLLRERSDITSVASRILVMEKDMIKEPLDKKDYWWLFESREQDEEFEKAFSSVPEFFTSLGLSPDIFKKAIEEKKTKSKKEKGS
jgi:hypothetical protein